jgi:trimeric autotransporter adhesin
MPTIPNLPAASTANDQDLLVINQGGVTKSATKAQLVAATLAVANAAQSTATAASSTATAASSTANAAQSTANAALPKAGGTMTGGINMGSQALTSLAAPSNATDAATKGYVDTGVSSANSAASAAQSTANTAVSNASTAQSAANAAQTTANNALPKAGGTMTGGINMGSQGLTNLATPSASTDASTKGYVDTGLTAKLDKSGGTMTGALNMGSQGLTNLTTPVSSTDAATKGYVDTGLGGKQNTTATTTGVSIALVTPQEYGSYGTPETGNITVSLTSAVRGVDQILYHDDSVAPTITVTGGTAIQFGTASYDLTKVNVIAFWFMGGTNVGYIITPAV